MEDSYRITELRIPTDDCLLSSILYSPKQLIEKEPTIVILVHGFCGNREEGGLFSSIASRLAENGYYACCYDCRGIRNSEGSYGGSTLFKHTIDFSEVVKYLPPIFRIPKNRVIGLGFSLGATIILESLWREKTKLSKLILLSPAIRPSIDMWPRYVERASLSPSFYKNDILLEAPILNSIRDTNLVKVSDLLN